MAITVFRNVPVYPGHGDRLLPPHDVTIDGTTIATMTLHDPAGSPPPEATIIDGQGRTLMPGLIDAHWHAAFTSVSPFVAMPHPIEASRNTALPPSMLRRRPKRSARAPAARSAPVNARL